MQAALGQGASETQRPRQLQTRLLTRRTLRGIRGGSADCHLRSTHQLYPRATKDSRALRRDSFSSALGPTMYCEW
jgi:hypothetical protein